MPDSQPDLPRRRLRWILLPALLVALIIGVLLSGRRDLPGFEARVAALRAAGQPVSPTDLPGSTPPAPAVATGIFLLDQALERLNNRLTAPGNGPYWNKPDSPHHAFLQETEPLRRELHLLLAPDPVLRSLHEARSHPGGPISFSRGMTLSGGVLNVELWLLASSTHNLQQGQIDDAVDCLTDAVRLRTVPRPERGFILWAFDAGTYTRSLIALLESGKLTPQHCHRLQQAFEQLDQAPILRDYLLVERVGFITDTRFLATVGARQYVSFSNSSRLRDRIEGALGWLRHRMHVRLGFYDRAASLALDAYADQLGALDRIGDPKVLTELKERATRIQSEPRLVRELYFGPPPSVREGAFLTKAHARLGLLAVAAHRYRLDHNGAFPSAPSDLVPRYLPTLPTDPFGGGLPTFERLDPGLAIGFDRTALHGMQAPAPTDPGGSGALLHFTR
jgi:hypothetical protein